MGKILDYDEMNDILDGLDSKIIKKKKPIGYTYFGYPIDHFVYGHGKYHVIITGGTHSSELISNVFVIKFMEKLCNKEIDIDKNLYTIHFIPIVNPEGTIIVTSAIRSLIPRNISDEEEQTYCLAYYRNSYIEGNYVNKYGDRDYKLQQMMFRHATPDILDDRHKVLKDYLNSLFKENNLPTGCMINWSSNGRGVDLNSNIENSSLISRVENGEEIYASLHLNNIRRDKLGPLGCPYFSKKGEIEKENEALLNFYSEIKMEHNLIGSFIYHSCGDIVYYLGEAKKKNPWVNLTKEAKEKNYDVAKVYADKTGYKLDGLEIYTTMDSKLKSLFPVSLLIELGGVRATPLSQFMDLDLEGSSDEFKMVYSKIINDNILAIIDTLPVMLDLYNKYNG